MATVCHQMAAAITGLALIGVILVWPTVQPAVAVLDPCGPSPTDVAHQRRLNQSTQGLDILTRAAMMLASASQGFSALNITTAFSAPTKPVALPPPRMPISEASMVTTTHRVNETTHPVVLRISMVHPERPSHPWGMAWELPTQTTQRFNKTTQPMVLPSPTGGISTASMRQPNETTQRSNETTQPMVLPSPTGSISTEESTKPTEKKVQNSLRRKSKTHQEGSRRGHREESPKLTKKEVDTETEKKVQNSPGSETTQRDSDSYREALGLSKLMPLCLVWFSCTSKPIVMWMLFGPHRPNLKVKYDVWSGLRRDGLLLSCFALMALAVYTFMHDLRKALTASLQSQLFLGERLHAAFIAIAVSANMPSAFAAVAIEDMYGQYEQWVKVHSENVIGDRVCLMVRTHGGVFVAYQKFMKIYAFVGLLLLVYSVGAIFAYCWFIVPVLAFTFGVPSFAMKILFDRMLSMGHGEYSAIACAAVETADLGLVHTDRADRMIQKKETIEQRQRAMSRLNPSVKIEMADATYCHMWRTFLSFGFPFDPFIYTLLCMIVPAMVQGTVILAARLYSGRGYWESFEETWQDRTLIHFQQTLASSMSAKLELFWSIV